MKKFVRLLCLVLAVVVVFMFAGCSKKKTGTVIGILQLVDHEALDAAREGFVKALEDNGYKDGDNITIDYQNAQADSANLSTISERFVSNKVDLILAIATPAAQSVAAKTSDIPILGTAITDYEVARLVDSNENPGKNVTGTSDLNPIEEQIDLILKLAPETKTIGVIYNSSEDNSILQAQIAKEVIEDLGLSYTEVTISNSNEVQQAAQSIVNKCDAIYLPTDNTVASAMPSIHSITSESKTPVICGEANMVRSGGLATIGINYYDLGYQTGLMAVKVLKDEAEPASMPVEYADKLYFTINGNIAEEIGVEIPEDLQEYVEYN